MKHLIFAAGLTVGLTVAFVGPSIAQSSGTTGPRSNQGAGQSTTAKHNAVTPEPSATGGPGQESSGEAKQIEQSAKPLKLTDAQRQQIRSYFAGKAADRAPTANFTLSIGAAVPKETRLEKLPPEVSSAMGGHKGDEYIIIGNQLVIVDQSARRVVAIVPDIG
jgi:Protein of unknown function (DUF1236)